MPISVSRVAHRRKVCSMNVIGSVNILGPCERSRVVPQHGLKRVKYRENIVEVEGCPEIGDVLEKRASISGPIFEGRKHRRERRRLSLRGTI